MAKATEVNLATGQHVERDMTEAEITELQAVGTERAAEAQSIVDAKASAVAKLQALGLTVEEVKAAFGLEAE